jgi:hypothetical protein
MLKLQYPTMMGLHIGDMPLTVLRMLQDFLPLCGKQVLPGPMPRGFILPPGIAEAISLMSPVPHAEFSALRHQQRSAARAFTGKMRLRLLALTVDHGKSHT